MKIMSFIIFGLFGLINLLGCSDFVSVFYGVGEGKQMKSDANLINDMNGRQSDMQKIFMDMQGLPTADMQGLPTADMQGLPTADMQGLPTADMQGLPTADMQMVFVDMYLIADDMIVNDMRSLSNQDGQIVDMGLPIDQGYVVNAPCGANCPEMEMIFIRAGSFNMGSRVNPNEQPIHPVQINHDFYVGKTEVTVGQYRACVNAQVCTAPNDFFFTSYCNWTNYVDLKESSPVNCIDWLQARIFAKWVGGDLLTEAQWEYVATAEGQDISYPWGSMEPTCEFANFYDHGYCVNPPGTQPTCSLINGHTAQGVCDMAGNVSEWVLDEWHDSYMGAPSDEMAWCNNHICDDQVRFHVYRGGSWFDDLSFLRAHFRNQLSTFSRNVEIGFRISYPAH